MPTINNTYKLVTYTNPTTNNASKTRIKLPAIILVIKGSVLLFNATSKSYSSSSSEMPSSFRRLLSILKWRHEDDAGLLVEGSRSCWWLCMALGIWVPRYGAKAWIRGRKGRRNRVVFIMVGISDTLEEILKLTPTIPNLVMSWFWIGYFIRYRPTLGAN